MKKRLRQALALSGAALLLVLTACGSKSNERTVDVKLTTYTLEPDKTSISAGTVTFHAHNDATDQEHELIVFKTDLAANALPLDGDGNVDENQITAAAAAEDIPIGKSQDATGNLAAGHYVLFCNKAGHYKQGMYTDFTVNP
jgi:uncharacterized cupredoxin-like copper-binding protein